MNDSEQALYINLQKTLANDFIVLSKVRIEEFIFASYKKRNEIKSRHVDFLICDIRTTEPLLAIELDGLSHLSPVMVDRDQFVDELYNSVGLPFIHVLKDDNFEKEAEKIKDLLNNK